MPYVRRRRPYRRRRPIGRRRYGRPRYGYRRKRRIGRIPRNPYTGYLRTKCVVQSSLVIPDGPVSSGIPFAFQWALSDISQATQYATMFRQYRIRGISMMFIPTTNTSNMSNPTWRMLYNFNPVGAVPPQTVNIQEEKQNNKCKWMIANSTSHMKKKVFYKPRHLQMLYEGQLGTGYSPGRTKQWISTRDPQVPHYGMEGFFDTSGNLTGGLNSEVCVSIRTMYYLEFKGVI